jgi:hypothetical protein
MYDVYIPVSRKIGRFYVGSTDDVERRLFQHNAGYSKSTRHGVPWRLVHVCLGGHEDDHNHRQWFAPLLSIASSTSLRYAGAPGSCRCTPNSLIATGTACAAPKSRTG